MPQPTFEKEALDYLSRGWSVIPLRPRDKRPAIRWQEYQERLASQEDVKAWFRHWPDANVGVVTGNASGLIVVDIDPKHGGEDSLARLERQHGPLPPTVEAATGGGGRHIYFAHPGGVVRNRVALAPGIDVRGDGGYVVAPPSVHTSGKPYAWLKSHNPDTLEPAPMPGWLLRELTGDEHRLGHPLTYWRHLAQEGVPEGERNNTIASLTGHLLWHGVDPDVTLELLLCWNRIRCRPPLSDEEVVRTVENITRLHHERAEDNDPEGTGQES